jgi:hypothetical protein
MLRCLAVLVALATASCALTRDIDDSSGAHPLDWSLAGSDDFHGRWLTEKGYPLDECRRCHGQSYMGGDVDVSCAVAGCHPRGVEECGTCHGQYDDPLPFSGAHQSHRNLCSSCHRVPGSIDAANHLDGSEDVVFGDQATECGESPEWIVTTRQCADTCCHGVSSLPWDDGGSF